MWIPPSWWRWSVHPSLLVEVEPHSTSTKREGFTLRLHQEGATHILVQVECASLPPSWWRRSVNPPHLGGGEVWTRQGVLAGYRHNVAREAIASSDGERPRANSSAQWPPSERLRVAGTPGTKP